MNGTVELDPEMEALEEETRRARKAREEREAAQKQAEQALAQLVGIARLQGGGVGDITRELKAEMAAVHPEWNRRGRREFVKSFRLKGRKVRRSK